ncbi:SMI1/KNR4 family protein [Anatilimnocola floriformis]|uniref:SMI1/KNR4 family protein n=1 Tax=Anatilimnocola floriformis TaxID=2948575 RepID=UPI0020C54148|nr:SMI1/KNR4 family protein [Anatilimnocola floriformis]
MLDYARWLSDSASFLDAMRGLPGDIQIELNIAPPVELSELASLQNASRLRIPTSLKQFWMQGSRHARGTYSWDAPAAFRSQIEVAFSNWSSTHVWGGPEFTPAEDVCRLTHDLVSWSEGFGEEYPRDARLWLHSFPLIPAGNGDHVGLYVRDDTDDPPVVFLCHDGGSAIIAPNLDTFLRRWEDVGYLGVEFIMNFCRPEQQFAPAAFSIGREAVRSLLMGVARADLVKPGHAMTLKEWQQCVAPERMIDWLEERGALHQSRLRVYACACCRRLWDRLGTWTQRALEVAERYTRGEATESELREAQKWLSEGDSGKQIQQQFPPVELMLGNVLNFVGNPNAENPLADPEYAAAVERFTGAIRDSANFSKTQGPLHDIAHTAIMAHSWISQRITSHLDDPEIATERAAHADLIRQVFAFPS